MQDVGSRVNGIGAYHVLITNFRSNAYVLAPDRVQHIGGHVGRHSIHTPLVSEVVGMYAGAKGKFQSNFASHVLTLLKF